MPTWYKDKLKPLPARGSKKQLEAEIIRLERRNSRLQSEVATLRRKGGL